MHVYCCFHRWSDIFPSGIITPLPRMACCLKMTPLTQMHNNCIFHLYFWWNCEFRVKQQQPRTSIWRSTPPSPLISAITPCTNLTSAERQQFLSTTLVLHLESIWSSYLAWGCFNLHWSSGQLAQMLRPWVHWASMDCCVAQVHVVFPNWIWVLFHPESYICKLHTDPCPWAWGGALSSLA